MKKLMSILLVLLLVLVLAGCGGVGQDQPQNGAEVVGDGDTIGEGAKTFQVEIVDLEGKSIQATVKTDEKTVGEALQALGVLEGEEGPYGLYIKAVNGTTLDYEKDGAYWAFYIDGAYANTGVDETDIVETSAYALKAEKG